MASFVEALQTDTTWDDLREDEATNIVAALYKQDDATWHRYDDMVDLTYALSRTTITSDASMARPDKRTRAQTCGEARLPECNHLDEEDLPPVHASKVGPGNRVRSSSMGVGLTEPSSDMQAQAPSCCFSNTTLATLLVDNRTPEPEQSEGGMIDLASNRSTPTRQLTFEQP
eukprot:m.29507 g.29507  ORF g.29507 m.29507 type:complete len:172 (+) comp11950_c0_seq1:226-741(+)